MMSSYSNLTIMEGSSMGLKIKQEKLNKDGKKGMRKTLSILLVVLIGLCMFTSCNSESKLTEELVSVELVTGQSKALTATLDFDTSKVAQWKYTAKKADGGLDTGNTGGTGESNAVVLVDNKKQKLFHKATGILNFLGMRKLSQQKKAQRLHIILSALVQ